MCNDGDMKRTTIVLPDELAALLERERRRRGVSTAAIVREALDAYLAPPTQPLPFVALGRSGHRDTGQDMEEILAREWTYERLMGVPEPASPAPRPGNDLDSSNRPTSPDRGERTPAVGGAVDGVPAAGQRSRRAGVDATSAKEPVASSQEAP